MTREKEHTIWTTGPSVDRDTVRYAAYIENEHGEMLIFIVDVDHIPRLFHSDATPKEGREVTEDGVKFGVLLSGLEQAWLRACWHFSAAVRERRPGVEP